MIIGENHMNATIKENLEEARIQVRGNYCDGGDICLEIPAFFIPTEYYKDFGLSILNPWESSLKYIRIINPKEIEGNYVRLRTGERAELFDLAADDFKAQVVNFIYS
jgi:hypothetical protein